MKPLRGAPRPPRASKPQTIPQPMWQDLIAAARIYPDKFQFRLAAVRIGNAYNLTQRDLLHAGVIEQLNEKEQEKFDREFHAAFPPKAGNP